MTDERPHMPHLPSWVVAALVAGSVTGPLGWVGHDMMSAQEQPAVLAQGVARLTLDVDRLSKKLDEVSGQLHQAGADRWRRSDQLLWEEKLEQRLRDTELRVRSLELREREGR